MRHQSSQLFSEFYWWRTTPSVYGVTLGVTLDATDEASVGDSLTEALSEINPTRHVAIDEINVEFQKRDGEIFEAEVTVSVTIIARGFDEAASFVYSALNPWSQTTPKITSITLSESDVDGNNY